MKMKQPTYPYRSIQVIFININISKGIYQQTFRQSVYRFNPYKRLQTSVSLPAESWGRRCVVSLWSNYIACCALAQRHTVPTEIQYVI